MEQRFNIQETESAAFDAMLALERYLAQTELLPGHKHLIKIRASQLNGCAYCINMHTRDARKDGETEQRIYLLSAWRETNLFSHEEKAILAFTEEATQLRQGGVSDQVYDAVATLFGTKYTAQLLMAIATINAWNRISIVSRKSID